MRLLRKLTIPWRLAAALCKMAVVYMPGPMGNRLRYLYYRRRFKACGENVIIDTGVLIDGEELISIGSNVHIDKYCVIQTGRSLQGKILRKPAGSAAAAEGELRIGSNVHIVQFCMIMAYGGVSIADRCTLSAGTKVYSLSNLPSDPEDPSAIVSIMPYDQAPFVLSPVTLKDNVWVGLNSILMPGASIAANSFVVSNALVMGEHPENSVLSGHPARRIRARYS